MPRKEKMCKPWPDPIDNMYIEAVLLSDANS